jgi:hypothetical protein
MVLVTAQSTSETTPSTEDATVSLIDDKALSAASCDATTSRPACTDRRRSRTCDLFPESPIDAQIAQCA